jgi:hypothetical protein
MASSYDAAMLAVAPFLLLHIALAIPPRALPPLTAATAVAEAAAIWARHGVVVDVAAPCERAADDATLLAVVVTPARTLHAPSRQPALGAIQFDEAGAPAPTITLFLGDLLRFVESARILGAGAPAWPTGLRERAVGRAAGRVIAHEIGHYLLQMPEHTATGLMRAGHSADEFVSPAREGFELSEEAAARLARAVGKEKRPAEAGPSNQLPVKDGRP